MEPILTREMLFEASAEIAWVIVPGGCIAVKVVERMTNQAPLFKRISAQLLSQVPLMWGSRPWACARIFSFSIYQLIARAGQRNAFLAAVARNRYSAPREWAGQLVSSPH